VDGHGATQWADALSVVALEPRRRDELGLAAVEHARCFSWDRTTDALLDTYTSAAIDFAERQRRILERMTG
jgi:D-inositol-3-phosphate glycosyltransferase